MTAYKTLMREKRTRLRLAAFKLIPAKHQASAPAAAARASIHRVAVFS
jgi:hypothetical protein